MASSTATPPTPTRRGDTFYTPRRVKVLLSHLGELEAGRFPARDAQVAESERARGRVEFESKPPSATILVYADLTGAIACLPEWERSCVHAFAAALGGGPWDERYAGWHGGACGDECDNRTYGHAARYLGRRKADFVTGFRLACCRIMLLLGGAPDDWDRCPASEQGYAEELEAVGWTG